MTTVRRTTLAPAVGQVVVAVSVGAYAMAFVAQPLITRVISVADVLDALSAVSGIAAIVALTVAGALSWATGPAHRLAVVAWFVATLWLIVYFAKSPVGTADARWVAVALPPVLAAGALELSIGKFHSRGLAGRTRFLVNVLWLTAIVVSLVRFATYSPFYEVACAPDCQRPAAAIFSLGLDARRVTSFALTATGILASTAALAICGAAALRHSYHPAVRLAASGGGLFALGLAALSLGPAAIQSFEPTVRAAIGVGATLFAAGMALDVMRVVLVRQRLHRLVDDLEAPSAGALAAALGRVLGDPGLRVGYYVPGGSQLVAASGVPFSGGASVAASEVSTIERSGEPIAVIQHRPGIDLTTLDTAGGAALLMALDNERLDAAALAQLIELQVARQRIVERADTERKRIERDLHDGAQHGLLAAAFALRSASSAAEETGSPALAEMRQAEQDLSELIGALRKFARGVYPPLLAAAGLGPALKSLSDESPVPLVVILQSGEDQPGAELELAAYRIVVDALTDAVARRANELSVTVDRDTEKLRLSICDDGSETTSPPPRIADRAGAAGGRALVDAGSAGRRHCIVVELPCV